jgi:small subunit ribosomal protein S2
MRDITLEELLEAGCHFGHQVTRQNPKARDFIFEARDNIHIIDLEKTREYLLDAAKFVKGVAMSGGSLLILGTKRQAQPILDEEIRKLKEEGADNIYWVTKRWVGGTLTNLSEVSKNFRKLKDFEKNLKDDFVKAKYTKREVGEWEKERQKLEGFYGGIASMTKIPDAIFIIDTHNENLAVREARMMNVKMVGITDTNSDPTLIDYPIPANDDAVGSLRVVINYILDAWREGKKEQGKLVETESKKQSVSSADKESGEEKKAEKKEEKAESEKVVKKEKVESEEGEKKTKKKEQKDNKKVVNKE